ncbi:MAG: hypothetical protein ACK41O_20585 [Runella zeae]
MAYLGKTIIKKWALDELNPFFKKYGFKKVNQFDNTYFHKIEKNIVYSISLSAGTGQSFSIGGAGICFLEMEKTLINILQFNPEVNEPNFIRTIKLGITTEKYGKMAKGVEVKDDVIEICNNFKIAFTDYYLPTFEKYSDPKNVLELWDSLPTMLSKADNFPSADNYSKIIILSKICNDKSYQKRIDETITFFQSEINKGEDWMQNKLDVFLKVVKYLEENEI